MVLDLPAHIPVVISIHALREEGDGDLLPVGRVRVISIHALREEGDDKRVCKGVILIISIHALREEGDASWLSLPL